MKRKLSWAATFLATVICGCGDSGPPLVPVGGTVTRNGAPLEGATVSFIPDPSNKFGRPAEGKTGPRGKYKTTTSRRPGVVPGKYTVAVSRGSADSTRVEAQFPREVPPNGTTIDLDVKAMAGGQK